MPSFSIPLPLQLVLVSPVASPLPHLDLPAADPQASSWSSCNLFMDCQAGPDTVKSTLKPGASLLQALRRALCEISGALTVGARSAGARPWPRRRPHPHRHQLLRASSPAPHLGPRWDPASAAAAARRLHCSRHRRRWQPVASLACAPGMRSCAMAQHFIRTSWFDLLYPRPHWRPA